MIFQNVLIADYGRMPVSVYGGLFSLPALQAAPRQTAPLLSSQAAILTVAGILTLELASQVGRMMEEQERAITFINDNKFWISVF